MIPKDDKDVKEIKDLPKSARRLYYLLSYRRNFFMRGNKLAADGSFYANNAGLAKDIGVSRDRIRLAKKILKEAGLITYRTHQGRGKATNYWILDTPPQKRKSDTPGLDTQPPLNPEAVKDLAKLKGKDFALKFWAGKGYKEAEIKAILDA